jgi:hypothetical protein
MNWSTPPWAGLDAARKAFGPNLSRNRAADRYRRIVIA